MFRTLESVIRSDVLELYNNWYKPVRVAESLTATRTGLYQLRYSFKNFAPDDGLKSPKHVERLMISKGSL